MGCFNPPLSPFAPVKIFSAQEVTEETEELRASLSILEFWVNGM